MEPRNSNHKNPEQTIHSPETQISLQNDSPVCLFTLPPQPLHREFLKEETVFDYAYIVSSLVFYLSRDVEDNIKTRAVQRKLLGVDVRAVTSNSFLSARFNMGSSMKNNTIFT
jgi:hypothetical protein